MCIVLCALEEVKREGGPNFCTGLKFKLYGSFFCFILLQFLLVCSGFHQKWLWLNIVHTCELIFEVFSLLLDPFESF